MTTLQIPTLIPTPTTAFASTPASVTPPAAHSVAPSLDPVIPAGAVLTQVASVLGGVLLLILGAVWLARRLGWIPQVRNNKLLNVRTSCQVGQRERVVIVEVESTWLVLGVTAQQVTLLHTMPSPPAELATATQSEKAVEFSQLLKKIVNRPEKSV